MSDGEGYQLDPRELLWSELFAMAESERANGDGRALRLLERYRETIGKQPAEKPNGETPWQRS